MSKEKIVNVTAKSTEGAALALKGAVGDIIRKVVDNEKRMEMFKIMSSCVKVTPEDILRSVEKHITNIAIQNEIRTAVSIYDNARQFLTALDG